MTKDDRLLLATKKLQSITQSLKEIISALSAEEKMKLVKKLNETKL